MKQEIKYYDIFREYAKDRYRAYFDYFPDSDYLKTKKGLLKFIDMPAGVEEQLRAMAAIEDFCDYLVKKSTSTTTHNFIDGTFKGDNFIL